jgi:hypothetical protein
MPFSEMAFQAKIIEKHNAERFKNQLIVAAFVGYQQSVMNGYKKTFSKYLNDLGLSDKKDKLSKEDRKEITKKAYETGARVMGLLKGTKL